MVKSFTAWKKLRAFLNHRDTNVYFSCLSVCIRTVKYSRYVIQNHWGGHRLWTGTEALGSLKLRHKGAKQHFWFCQRQSKRRLAHASLWSHVWNIPTHQHHLQKTAIREELWGKACRSREDKPCILVIPLTNYKLSNHKQPAPVADPKGT